MQVVFFVCDFSIDQATQSAAYGHSRANNCSLSIYPKECDGYKIIDKNWDKRTRQDILYFCMDNFLLDGRIQTERFSWLFVQNNLKCYFSDHVGFFVDSMFFYLPEPPAPRIHCLFHIGGK